MRSIAVKMPCVRKNPTQKEFAYVQLKPEAVSLLSCFVKFALEWFSSEDVHSSVYYNGNQNRVDILFGPEAHA